MSHASMYALPTDRLTAGKTTAVRQNPRLGCIPRLQERHMEGSCPDSSSSSPPSESFPWSVAPFDLGLAILRRHLQAWKPSVVQSGTPQLTKGSRREANSSHLSRLHGTLSFPSILTVWPSERSWRCLPSSSSHPSLRDRHADHGDGGGAPS